MMAQCDLAADDTLMSETVERLSTELVRPSDDLPLVQPMKALSAPCPLAYNVLAAVSVSAGTLTSVHRPPRFLGLYRMGGDVRRCRHQH